MKSFLRKNVAPHPLRYDELYTIVTEAEAILNSCPLMPLKSDDISEGAYWTAGHFLIGRPIQAPPAAPPTREKISSLRCWNLVNRLTFELWRQWLGSYLASCSSRAKWIHHLNYNIQ